MKANLSKRAPMVLHRDILKRNTLVYLVVAPKPIRRKNGRSRIAYIGTTQKGVSRMALSAAFRAQEVFDRKSFQKLEVCVVSSKGRPGRIAWWKILERALLAKFFERYHEFPLCNRKGARNWKSGWSRFIREDRMRKIVGQFDAS